MIDRAHEAGEDVGRTPPRILIMDIERAPMLSYLWSFWQNGVSPDFQERPAYILSWAAKWLGETEVMSDALCYDKDYTPGKEDDSRMLEGMWNLLDACDFVVAHNGDNFDIKILNTAFLLNGMRPPSPYKTIDTLKIVKRTFKFDSNKLEYLLQTVFGYGKEDSGGFKTWRGCMQGDMDAWRTMIKYNEADVTRLEELYLEIRAWDRLHPSAATWGGASEVPTCTVCSSEDVEPTKKTVATGASVFPVWRCNECGHNMRGRTSLLTPKQKGALLLNSPN